MELPQLHGIITPLATPLKADGSLDEVGLTKLVEFQINAGVHGLWVLGTTARFDLLADDLLRRAAEVVASVAAGRLPLVLNVSDMGTDRTLARARLLADLPYDYYAALPPWYQPMTRSEVADYYHTLADNLAQPLLIYNAPWICNQITFAQIRQLAEHPRIVGCKDVTPSLSRTLDWPVAERRRMNFSYLYGNDQMAISTTLGADGFVSATSNPLPELTVAIWNAARQDNAARSFNLQVQLTKFSRVMEFGPMLACLEVLCRHRGLFDRMLPSPLQSLDAETARRIIDVAELIGVEPPAE